METIVQIVTWTLIIGGSLAVLTGGIGVLRMPDFYTRGHAAAVTDTLGAGLILLGLMFQADVVLVAVKLAMVLFFLYVTSPTSTHALFKSAYAGGLRWDLVRDAGHATPPIEDSGAADDAAG